ARRAQPPTRRSLELPLSAPPRSLAQGPPRQTAHGQRRPARDLRGEIETRRRVPAGDRRSDLPHLGADGDAAPRASVRVVGRAAGRFPRAAGRLDRDPLGGQVAPREPPALLPALSPSLTRLEPEEPSPALAILEQIDLAARALVDRADARAHVPLVGLARPVTIDVDPDERLPRERTDQRIALPRGEQVTGV